MYILYMVSHDFCNGEWYDRTTNIGVFSDLDLAVEYSHKPGLYHNEKVSNVILHPYNGDYAHLISFEDRDEYGDKSVHYVYLKEIEYITDIPKKVRK